MRKIRIGIITYLSKTEDDSPYTDSYKFVDLYIKKINSIGAIPVGVFPNNNFIEQEALDFCDAFIIPGGNIVVDYMHQVIEYCILKNKPLLGICLGAEAINIYSAIIDKTNNYNEYRKAYEQLKNENDGTLLRRLNEESLMVHSNNITYNDYSNALHEIFIKENSHLFNIYGKSSIVVSMHGYDFKIIGSKFDVIAHSPDGVCEAIEYKDKNYCIIGVHFHPEILKSNEIFDYFYKEILKRKKYNKMNCHPLK